MPRKYLKLKEGAVPSILPGCPSYYSTQTTNKRSRLSIEYKDEELFSQALHLSLKSNIDENERFILNSFQDLQDKLPNICISNVKSYWYPNPNSLIFMRPRLDNKILVNIYLTVEIDLSVRAYRNGQVFPLSRIFVSDTRHLETLLDEIAVFSDSSETSLACTSNDLILHLLEFIYNKLSIISVLKSQMKSSTILRKFQNFNLFIANFKTV